MGIDQTKVANVLDGLTDRVVAQHAVCHLSMFLASVSRGVHSVPKNREIGLGVFESIQVVRKAASHFNLYSCLSQPTSLPLGM